MHLNKTYALLAALFVTSSFFEANADDGPHVVKGVLRFPKPEHVRFLVCICVMPLSHI